MADTELGRPMVRAAVGARAGAIALTVHSGSATCRPDSRWADRTARLSASRLATSANIGSTDIVKRIGLPAVVAGALVVAVLLTGCGFNRPSAKPPTNTTSPVSPGPTPSGSPVPTGTPGPTGSPSALIEFTVDGAGPYLIGASLPSLQAIGLQDVKTGGETCPENTTARGTGVWSDVRFSFRKDGLLYIAVNRSASIPTPSGAWLGTSLAQLKTIYKNISGQELKKGTASAFLVTTLSGRGILFDLDASKTVISMVAGDADYLRSSWVGGTDFC